MTEKIGFKNRKIPNFYPSSGITSSHIQTLGCEKFCCVAHAHPHFNNWSARTPAPHLNFGWSHPHPHAHFFKSFIALSKDKIVLLHFFLILLHAFCTKNQDILFLKIFSSFRMSFSCFKTFFSCFWTSFSVFKQRILI